jgi:hypothetical protein
MHANPMYPTVMGRALTLVFCDAVPANVWSGHRVRGRIVNPAGKSTLEMPETCGEEWGTSTVLNVLGKGDVLRQIPLSPGLLNLLGDYLERRGLSRDPAQCPPG